MTTQTTIRSYAVDPNGTIFTSDVTVFADDAGNEIARSNPHRVPYPPSATPPSSTLNGASDTALIAMATALWTAPVIAAYAAASKPIGT